MTSTDYPIKPFLKFTSKLIKDGDRYVFGKVDMDFKKTSSSDKNEKVFILESLAKKGKCYQIKETTFWSQILLGFSILMQELKIFTQRDSQSQPEDYLEDDPFAYLFYKFGNYKAAADT